MKHFIIAIFAVLTVAFTSKINAQAITAIEEETVELNSVELENTSIPVQFAADNLSGEEVVVSIVTENDTTYNKFSNTQNVYFYCYTKSGKMVTKKFGNKVPVEEIGKLESKYNSISFNCTSEKKGHKFIFNPFNRPWKIAK